jgi:hypothetical protein
MGPVAYPGSGRALGLPRCRKVEDSGRCLGGDDRAVAAAVCRVLRCGACGERRELVAGARELGQPGFDLGQAPGDQAGDVDARRLAAVTDVQHLPDAELGICTDTARKWRRRFAAARLPGLADAPRSGRLPSFTAADRAEVIALACALPAESGVPLARWSGPDLARELAARRQLAVSASTISRWLADDALKPWQHRSWISVRDPQFASKAAQVLDLYAGTWDGRPLGPDDHVICADEKTGWIRRKSTSPSSSARS